jgi:hypothetical protein
LGVPERTDKNEEYPTWLFWWERKANRSMRQTCLRSQNSSNVTIKIPSEVLDNPLSQILSLTDPVSLCVSLSDPLRLSVSLAHRSFRRSFVCHSM